MSTLTNLERARLLIEQSRVDLAVKELQQETAANPENPDAHALLALCLSQLQQGKEAVLSAQQAVHLAPAYPFTHYIYALVQLENGRVKEAESAVREALRLDPENAEYYALFGQILMRRARWQDAVDAAERGLAIDSEHSACANLRAHALIKLRRPDEAAGIIAGNLARDPENAYTHATLGWSLLEQGQPKQAMIHFREALRLEPEMEWARVGIIEAMKARNPIYRILLGYFFWMSRLGSQKQSAVIIGAYILSRVARGVAAAEPGLRPFVLPLIFAYALFAYVTWTSQPLFNLLLRLDPFGRLALTKRQIAASNWFGLTLLVSLGCFIGWLVTQRDSLLLETVGFLFISIPVAIFFRSNLRKSATPYSMIYGLIAGGIGLVFILQGFGIGRNIF
ncbi:MAG TPA: tetratricopeptide repeat protein [Capsulimonadaceae bacterium]|nr:tetratricopeptide repeat protein [Capsulimonadaceae bacterium]